MTTDELDSVLADADLIDNPGGGPGPVPGDQPAISNAPAPGYQPDPEILMMLKGILMMAGQGAASHFGSDHWLVDENQAEMIAIPLDQVLSKYLGSGYKMPPELTLALAVGAVFVPKYQQQKELEHAQKPESPEA